MTRCAQRFKAFSPRILAASTRHSPWQSRKPRQTRHFSSHSSGPLCSGKGHFSCPSHAGRSPMQALNRRQSGDKGHSQEIEPGTPPNHALLIRIRQRSLTASYREEVVVTNHAGVQNLESLHLDCRSKLANNFERRAPVPVPHQAS